MIEVRNVHKRFGLKVAVQDVSFTVDKGEVLGFLGPNAAGKSTTMRVITGFIPPTSGTAVIGGVDITEDPIAARKKIGYLPENAPTYHEMTVTGFLEFVAEIRGFYGRLKEQRVRETLERCFLEGVRFQTIATLSKGFKQRVCFAQSILHDPEYLVMDEPTDGLDPNQKHEVRSMIRTMARDKAIILSTHNLEEVDEVCTRAIIIAEGRIVADDTPEGLKRRSIRHGAVVCTVRTVAGDDVVSELSRIPEAGAVEVLGEEPSRITVRVYGRDGAAAPADAVMHHFAGKGRAPDSFFVEEGRLDEVFRTVTVPG